VTGLHALRFTRFEAVLAVLLLIQSVTEALYSSEQPAPTAVLLLAAVVPPLAVAFSHGRPEHAAAAVVGVMLLASLPGASAGTLGAGLAWLAVAFGLAAWTPRPWPWLLALAAAGTVQDLRAVGYEATDVVIDWVFIGFTVGVGRLVHRRTVHAEELTVQLDRAAIERETRTREAVNRERAVIARELHDIVANAVSLMVVQAGTARPTAERVDSDLAHVLETIERTGREALNELRVLLQVLRSADEPDLKPLPDLTRLDQLIDAVRRAGLDIRSSVVLPGQVPAGVALCAYRTVQEGLTNAMRYAAGSSVDLEVAADERTLRVRVHDHGGTTAAREASTGIGLAGLRERVALCGGRLTAGPDQNGYRLEALLPITQKGLPEEAPSIALNGDPR
jgi:signal transduction histidine kinase